MEDRNRYAPPDAVVADIPSTTDAVAACPDVVRSCRLLWLSCFLGIIPQLVVLKFDGPVALRVGGIIGALVGIGIGYLMTRWVTRKLAIGRNWMRWLMTVLNAVGLVSMIAFWDVYRRIAFPVYAARPWVAALAGVQMIIGIAAIVLLHTREARQWFGHMARRRDGAA